MSYVPAAKTTVGSCSHVCLQRLCQRHGAGVSPPHPDDWPRPPHGVDTDPEATDDSFASTLFAVLTPWTMPDCLNQNSQCSVTQK